MPFPRAHLLLSFLGTAWGGVEEWSTSLRVDQAVLPTAAVLASVRDRFETFHRSGDAGISQAALFIAVKAAVIGVDGRYPAEGNAITSVLAAAAPGAGAGVTNGYPQCTTVVTLRTALLRGKGSVGRMYLPSTAILVNSDGRIAAGQAQNLANAAGVLISDLNGLLDGDISVFGQGVGGTGPGSQRDVTGVRVGRVVDTQRRRRNQLDEGYVTAPVTGSTGN
jgi:hypothetical protein